MKSLWIFQWPVLTPGPLHSLLLLPRPTFLGPVLEELGSSLGQPQQHTAWHKVLALLQVARGEYQGLTDEWRGAKLSIAPPRSGKTVCPCPGLKLVEPASACRGAESVSWEGAGESGKPAMSWGGHGIKVLSGPTAQE